MDFIDKEMPKRFIKENDIRDIAQLNMFLKKMMGGMIEELLEAERAEHLGYPKHALSLRVRPHEEHNVYFSAYSPLPSVLLKRYVEGERADNEELFSEWDESLQAAASQVGYSAIHEPKMVAST